MTTRISPETAARVAAAWPRVCERIADGELIRQVLADSGVSRNEARAYRASDAGADADWQRAKEDSADAYFDEVRAMTNKAHADPGSARVNMDGLKWLAAKRNPRVYSDKAQLDVNVRTVDLTRIISEAQARLSASRERLVGAGPGEGRALLEAPRGAYPGAGGASGPGEPARGVVEAAIVQEIAKITDIL